MFVFMRGGGAKQNVFLETKIFYSMQKTHQVLLQTKKQHWFDLQNPTVHFATFYF